MVKREHLKGQNVMECIIIIMIEDDPFHISKIQAHTTGNNLFIKKKKLFFALKSLTITQRENMVVVLDLKNR